MTDKKEFDDLYLCGQAIIKSLEEAQEATHKQTIKIEGLLKFEKDKNSKMCEGLKNLLRSNE